ncbi:Uncharacterized protein APZ42_020481 [Daphnia magna]|uniref:Uncharacterized protein n=1 Tax=Daphnia magna TaxID=35525 RepID=A0A164XHV0_9CRUS|nr:Uncharacterized protein APZ42_020481 [Daphnia magna]
MDCKCIDMQKTAYLCASPTNVKKHIKRYKIVNYCQDANVAYPRRRTAPNSKKKLPGFSVHHFYSCYRKYQVHKYREINRYARKKFGWTSSSHNTEMSCVTRCPFNRQA